MAGPNDAVQNEVSRWWELEQKIADFLDEEGVMVMHVDDARQTFYGPLASYRSGLTPSPSPATPFVTSSLINIKIANSNKASQSPSQTA
jgi:hypothetical protein